MLEFLSFQVEIIDQIIVLTTSVTKLLQRLRAMIAGGKPVPVVLVFDDDRLTIRWDENTLKFGRISYRLIKTLYHAEGQMKTLTDIEEIVWGEAKHGTILTAVSRIRNMLTESHFPYRLENVGQNEWHCVDERAAKLRHISGYRLTARKM